MHGHGMRLHPSAMHGDITMARRIVERSQSVLSPASLQIRFDLRQGVGEWVERAPWKVEWGGGTSVENPHVQRVKYCELLVRLIWCARRCIHTGCTCMLACLSLLPLSSIKGDLITKPWSLFLFREFSNPWGLKQVRDLSLQCRSTLNSFGAEPRCSVISSQVTDFLMRVKSRRFPSIEKDMKMVLAHCGSLLLDPTALCQVCPAAFMIDDDASFDMLGGSCCTGI